MTKEAKITQKAIKEAEGLPIEKQNEIYLEALTKIGNEHRKKYPNIDRSSWDVTPRNSEVAYGYVPNNGWV